MNEVEIMEARNKEQGVTYHHTSWTEEGQRLTGEEKASAINRIDDWLAIPKNKILSRIGGRIMLLRDSVLPRTDFRDGWPGVPVVLTKIQERAQQRDTEMLELLVGITQYIEGLPND